MVVRKISGRSVKTIAARIAPLMLPSPPSVTITTISIDLAMPK